MKNPLLIREGFPLRAYSKRAFELVPAAKSKHTKSVQMCACLAYARRRALAFTIKSTELINIEHTIPSTHSAVRDWTQAAVTCAYFIVHLFSVDTFEKTGR